MVGKALITGGAGFIGSHLAQRLRDQGRQLILVDDLSTGRRRNVQHLLDDRCALIEASADTAVRDPALLQNVTEVYHLAAAVGVRLVVDDPAAMIRSNVDQTLAVLEAANLAGAAVLFASSSEVYGRCPVLPLHEDLELVFGPTTTSRWSYGLTKAIGEQLILDYARRRGQAAVIVRLFNTIGPRQIGRYGMVVPRFVDRAVAGKPLEVYGDGQQTRTFCDVRDVADACVKLLGNTACHGQIFNVGSDRPVTIDGLADLVIERSGSPAGKVHVPYEAVYGPGFEDPPHRLADTSKIRRAIGFEPGHSLEQTIEELIALRRDEARQTPPGDADRGSAAIRDPGGGDPAGRNPAGHDTRGGGPAASVGGRAT